MTEQPEALRLAESLEITNGLLAKKEAAAELRRLHTENTTLSKTARLYEELRRVIDDGSESMTHEDAIEDVKVFHRMYEQNSELKKINAQLLEALEGLERYSDGIICYASTMGEYEPNLLVFNARAAIAAAKGEA